MDRERLDSSAFERATLRLRLRQRQDAVPGVSRLIEAGLLPQDGRQPSQRVPADRPIVVRLARGQLVGADRPIPIAGPLVQPAEPELLALVPARIGSIAGQTERV